MTVVGAMPLTLSVRALTPDRSDQRQPYPAQVGSAIHRPAWYRFRERSSRRRWWAE